MRKKLYPIYVGIGLIILTQTTGLHSSSQENRDLREQARHRVFNGNYDHLNQHQRDLKEVEIYNKLKANATAQSFAARNPAGEGGTDLGVVAWNKDGEIKRVWCTIQ